MPTAGIAVRGVEAFIDLVVCYVLLYSIAAIAGVFCYFRPTTRIDS